jgi:hypothetical protein
MDDRDPAPCAWINKPQGRGPLESEYIQKHEMKPICQARFEQPPVQGCAPPSWNASTALHHRHGQSLEDDLWRDGVMSSPTL